MTVLCIGPHLTDKVDGFPIKTWGKLLRTVADVNLNKPGAWAMMAEFLGEGTMVSPGPGEVLVVATKYPDAYAYSVYWRSEYKDTVRRLEDATVAERARQHPDPNVVKRLETQTWPYWIAVAAAQMLPVPVLSPSFIASGWLEELSQRPDVPSDVRAAAYAYKTHIGASHIEVP